MSPRKPAADPDDDLLSELRDRYSYAMNEWRDIRAAAKDDMRVVGGDPWEPKDRKAREDAGRVCLSLDELHQYYNQVINDVRANPRAPKFDPIGNGANDKTARFYADKQREIEYRSQAQIAYTTAFQNAVHQGYGWIRYNTKWAPKSFNLDIVIEEIPNPDLIVGDPDALRPTSSDQKYLFDLTSMSVKEFRREFPSAEITSFTPEIIAQAPAWISPERVQIAKYWTVEPTSKELYLFQMPDGSTASFYEDELQDMPPGAQVLDHRTDDEVPDVCMYLTNGVEILKKPGQKEKKVRWAGKYIPYVSCFGMVIYVDEGSGPKRKILSMTRLARDPYMLYCYYRTSQAELVGMTPKIPYFVRRGSLIPSELENLQKSLHEPIAVIQVENFVDGLPAGERPEFPIRNPFEPYIQNLEIGAESARRAIQAAMGISPLPTQAQSRNEKSGTALRQIESSQQKGAYHFSDHYDAMLQHGGTISEDLMDKVYDTARDVGIRDAQGNGKMMRINDPNAQGQDALPSIKGDHVVTISTGPAFESQRAEGAAFTETLLSNIGMVAQTAGPKPAAAVLGLAIKLKNLGELGDEMAKIITPPEFQPSQDGQPDLPPQVKAQLMQLQSENQQMKQVIATKQAEKQAEGQIKLQQTQMQEAADSQRSAQSDANALQIARENNATRIAVADIAAKFDEIKLEVEQFRATIDAVKEQRIAQHDRTHEHVQNELDRQHEREMATIQHAQAMQQTDQQGQIASQQAEQQAALQPPAETGA